MPATPKGASSSRAIICAVHTNGQKPPLMASTVAVGVARVVLHLPESGSLKSKRQGISGLLRRVRAKFQVAAAEIGERDRWQLAELAIASVIAAGPHAAQPLSAPLSTP